MSKRIFLVAGGYLPGYKSGGPIRAIVNIVDWLGDDYQFFIMALDRDTGDTAPYPNVNVGEWQQVGKAQVLYTPMRQLTIWQWRDALLSQKRNAIFQAWIDLRSWRVAGKLGPLFESAATRDKLKPAAIWEIERGRALPLARIEEASAVRSAFYRAMLRLFDRFDALVMPSAQIFPFDVTLDWPAEVAGRPMDTYHRWMETVVPASLLGLPAIALPAGFSPSGLPAGFQVIGRPRDDLGVLRLAKAYERATDWLARAPEL